MMSGRLKADCAGKGDVNADQLRTFLSEEGFASSDHILDAFAAFFSELVRLKDRYNLAGGNVTAKDLVEHHLADALKILPYLTEKTETLLDIGSGGGFPGIPLAVMRNDIQFTLLDNRRMKVAFLESACRKIGLRHARVVKSSSSEFQREHARTFDVVTARAIGDFPGTLAATAPFARRNGRLILPRGADGEREAKDSADRIRKAGFRIDRIVPYRLPRHSRDRYLIILAATV